jgi:TetR/AcrR family transcriptional regulator, transcriptional repressor for nem operon
MQQVNPSPRKRGRPPKQNPDFNSTREAILRAGVAALTEKGFGGSGLDEILRRAQAPKGSFYHYFPSKEAFGAEAIASYGAWFAARLDRHFLDESLAPLDRLRAFIADAEQGMRRHEFRRGCLVGNLGQEMAALPERFRDQLDAVFVDWERRLAACLSLAQARGDIGAGRDCARLAHFFWIGWEGAVLRAKLRRSVEPLRLFSEGFFALLA